MRSLSRRALLVLVSSACLVVAPSAHATETPANRENAAWRAIYVSGELGFVRAGMGALKDNLGFDKASANGLLGGLGAGYRQKAYRLGFRFRDANTTEFSLWSLMLEGGMALPRPSSLPLEPLLFLRAGYVFDTGVERAVVASSLPTGNVLTPTVSVDGLLLGAEVAATYEVSKSFGVGPFVGVDFTFLHRAQPALPQSIYPLSEQTRTNALFGGTGSGVGCIFNAGLRATFDVGF